MTSLILLVTHQDVRLVGPKATISLTGKLRLRLIKLAYNLLSVDCMMKGKKITSCIANRSTVIGVRSNTFFELEGRLQEGAERQVILVEEFRESSENV